MADAATLTVHEVTIADTVPSTINEYGPLLIWAREHFPQVVKVLERDLSEGRRLALKSGQDLARHRPMLGILHSGCSRLLRGLGLQDGCDFDGSLVLDALAELAAGVYDRLEEGDPDEKEQFHQAVKSWLLGLRARLLRAFGKNAGPAGQGSPSAGVDRLLEALIELSIGGLQCLHALDHLPENLRERKGFGQLFGGLGRLAKGLMLLVLCSEQARIRPGFKEDRSGSGPKPPHPDKAARDVGTIIARLGKLLDQLTVCGDRVCVLFPGGHEGVWLLSEDLCGLRWRLELAPENAGSCEGWLIAQGPDAQGSLREERKAHVWLRAGSGGNAVLETVGAVGKPELPCPGPSFAAGKHGRLQLQEEDGELRVCGGTIWPDVPLTWQRQRPFKAWLEAALAIGEALKMAACLHPDMEKSFDELLKDLASLWKPPAWLKKWLRVAIERDPVDKRWKLCLDGGDQLRLAARWDLLRFVEDDLLQPTDQSPWVPEEFALQLALQGWGTRVSWQAWDMVAEPQGGAGGGLEDKLPLLAEFVREHLGTDNWNLLEPRLLGKLTDVNDRLRVELPIAVYLEPPIQSKLVVTVILHGEAALKMFPVVQQCLLAFRLGYLAGTLLRKALVQFSWYDQAEQGMAEWLLDCFTNAELQREVTDQYNQLWVPLGSVGALNEQEWALLVQKSIAWVYRRGGEKPGAQLNHAIRNYQLERLQTCLARLEAGESCQAWDVNTRSEALLYLYLWEAPQVSMPDVQLALQADLEANLLSRPRFLVYLQWLWNDSVAVDVPMLEQAIRDFEARIPKDAPPGDARRREVALLRALVYLQWQEAPAFPLLCGMLRQRGVWEADP